MGAGGSKVAAVQFGGGEIDQNQHAVPAAGQSKLIEGHGKSLLCHAVVACLEKDVAGGGGQLHGAVVIKPRGRGSAARLGEGGLRAVEGVAR